MPNPDDRAKALRARERLRDRFSVLREPTPTEQEIVQKWGGRRDPVVTVLCPVYNRANLIGDALHGFLSQRTDFPFRVVVRDDASTDGTQEVLREAEAAYPGVLQIHLSPVNTFGDRARRTRERLALVAGEFVALCDGDDVWIDPSKLQRQIDDLRRHPNIPMSVAGSVMIDVLHDTESTIGAVEESTTVHGWFQEHQYRHTSTFVIRAESYARMVNNLFLPHNLTGDYPTLSYMARHGGIRVIPGVVSVYWSDGQGIYSSLSRLDQRRYHYRNRRRLFWALGPPFRPDEFWLLLRREAKLYRLALSERRFMVALSRLPIYFLVTTLRSLRGRGARIQSRVNRALESVRKGGRR